MFDDSLQLRVATMDERETMPPEVWAAVRYAVMTGRNKAGRK